MDGDTESQLRSALRGLGDRDPREQAAILVPLLADLADAVGVWLLSHHHQWRANADDPISQIILVRQPLVAAHLRSTVSLARGDSAIPSAMATARACFEAGVTTGWICDPAGNGADTVKRVLAIEQEGVHWMRRVAKAYGTVGERWVAGAEEREQRLNAVRRTSSVPVMKSPPPMRTRLEEMRLDHKYPFYMMASESIHGGAVSGGDYGLGTGNIPYGYPDWIAVLDMCVVGARCAMLYASLVGEEPSLTPFDNFQGFAGELLEVLAP